MNFKEETITIPAPKFCRGQLVFPENGIAHEVYECSYKLYANSDTGRWSYKIRAIEAKGSNFKGDVSFVDETSLRAASPDDSIEVSIRKAQNGIAAGEWRVALHDALTAIEALNKEVDRFIAEKK